MTGSRAQDLSLARSFIEAQFPVAKLSKESFSERTAKQSQTLTGLGKWWGRKPLVLCRAVLLGLLLPATDDPAKDRDVFLRLMTMDDAGLLRRKTKNLPAKELWARLPPAERRRWFTAESSDETPKLQRGLSAEDKEALQARVFNSLHYEEKLTGCERPEGVDGPSPESWAVINAHLGTAVASLPELVAELGRRRFGHVPRVGDAFCGGGSIPFEAARLGCDTYASDLNPVAALLTWASLNIVGGGEDVAQQVREAQAAVYDAVDRQITEWGIEHRAPHPLSGRRWRADAYLYCVEATCPECEWRVPLLPTCVIGKGSNSIVELLPDAIGKRFNFAVRSGVNAAAMARAAEAGTVKDAELVCPSPVCEGRKRTPIKVIRGDGRGTFGDSKSLLRPWTNEDLFPREGDIFGERLYALRWVDSWIERDANGRERSVSERHFAAPDAGDEAREAQVRQLLAERFAAWQQAGYIPSRRIEPGAKTDEPIRTRGWTHWQHLFTPRQLLVNGLLAERAAHSQVSLASRIALLLGVGRVADWNSRLGRWHPGVGNEKSEQVFSNQALNTLFNYGCRPLSALETTWFARLIEGEGSEAQCRVLVTDGREIASRCDFWITDPPYADAVNYEEVSEFFLAWYEGRIPELFPDWVTDSRRALAVKGSDDGFRRAMVDVYRRLAEQMPDNGLQVVMFTHQDAAVWADLALILWAAGLKVCSAWCIATETTSDLKDGNYVQGTVLLVLRKQAREVETLFDDDVSNAIESEVRRQLDAMKALDDTRDPSFADTDYQLAAYAAALRVLTAHRIEGIDVAHELTRTRVRGEISPIQRLIERAVKIACDHLVPRGIESALWRSFGPLERLYLKGLELESHGERRAGVYQELARGFGVDDYKPLLAATRANETRLKTASEFGRRELGDAGFGASPLRQALFGAFKTAEADDSPTEAIAWLKAEVPNYAAARRVILAHLEWLATLSHDAGMAHWHADAEAAGLLAGALRNRQDNV